MIFKQGKRNRISLRGASCIVRVQMIAAVISREQLSRVARVAQDLVEIDHRIKFAAATYPVVNLLAYCFSLGSVEGHGRPRLRKRQE